MDNAIFSHFQYKRKLNQKPRGLLFHFNWKKKKEKYKNIDKISLK